MKSNVECIKNAVRHILWLRAVIRRARHFFPYGMIGIPKTRTIVKKNEEGEQSLRRKIPIDKICIWKGCQLSENPRVSPLSKMPE